MDTPTQAGTSNQTSGTSSSSLDVKRPDKVYPYRLNYWADIMSEDNTSELMNVLGIMLSMLGLLMKYKTCAWFGVLVAAVSYANVRSSYDNKQIVSTFMLSLSAVVMCYLISPAAIAHSLRVAPTDQQSGNVVSDGVVAGGQAPSDGSGGGGGGGGSVDGTGQT